ncbi:MAG: methyl-accepting chemotaxis protein [Leptospiraceae bacterium]|nr:methyl-accepting chemotaxis protein [Leptospiraceae bacterium]MCK6380878.1 methyl-accepting chemotaxis protein [Leptospiraceae bacterium]NUM41279.1 methyl-accepting chemotaxis protein [Leptospiraceae bacterium]
MSSEKKKFRIRYIIDKEFQLAFLLHNSIILILGVLVTLGVLYWVNETKYEGGAVFKLRQDPIKVYQKGFEEVNGVEVEKFIEKEIFLPDYDHKLDRFHIQVNAIVVLSSLFLVILAIFTIFNSHRMAGPIHNIKKSINRLLAGEKVERIRLRKTDEFKDLAEALNKLIEERIENKK